MSNWKAKSPDLIIMALRQGPMHGYEIIKFIEQRSDGYFSMGYGSLYPILHALEQDGCIQGTWEAIGETKEKKIYKLTAKGRKQVESVTNEYRSFIAAFKLLVEG